MSQILEDMREAVQHHQAADQQQPAVITGAWADHVERLERDNAALLAACLTIKDLAKLRDSTTATAQDQLYTIFKTAEKAITAAEAP